MALMDKHINQTHIYWNSLKLVLSLFSVHKLLGGLYTLQLNVPIDYHSSIVIVNIFTVFVILLRVCLQWHVNMACSGSSFIYSFYKIICSLKQTLLSIWLRLKYRPILLAILAWAEYWFQSTYYFLVTISLTTRTIFCWIDRNTSETSGLCVMLATETHP